MDFIIGIPQKEDLEYLLKKFKAYGIRYAIHNHGPEDKLYPNATVIVNLIKNLDKRTGSCFDMGHNMSDCHDPISGVFQWRKGCQILRYQFIQAAW